MTTGADLAPPTGSWLERVFGGTRGFPSLVSGKSASQHVKGSVQSIRDFKGHGTCQHNNGAVFSDEFSKINSVPTTSDLHEWRESLLSWHTVWLHFLVDVLV